MGAAFFFGELKNGKILDKFNESFKGQTFIFFIIFNQLNDNLFILL